MSHPDAERWNARYLNDPMRSRLREPRALVASHLDLLPSTGLALDVACGMASTSLFLARHGWRVIALDVAEAALRLAQVQIRKEKLSVFPAIMDLTAAWLPKEHFDAILNFYYLSRPMVMECRSALKAGGLLFFETFLFDSHIDMNPDYFLRPGELQKIFYDWEVLYSAELFRQQGRLSSEIKRVVQFIARKPK